MQNAQEKVSPKTIVLVTNQFRCERLIRSGKTLAELTNTELSVYSVQSSHYPQNPLALEHLYHVSKAHGAVMHISYGEDPAKQIISFIKHNRTRNVLTGLPKDAASILHTVWRKFTHVRFFTVDEAGNTSEVTRADIPLHAAAQSLA